MLERRMYFFVPYNLSLIQKGIQAGHAALEYAYTYGKTREYKNFITYSKTWIILNGGTTNDKNGTLNDIASQLYKNKIDYGVFREPDLNDALTAVCFLADETVWDYEKYPDFNPLGSEGDYQRWVEKLGEKTVFLRDLIRNKHLA